MKRPLVLMDWKNQHCENGHATQSNLKIQYNYHQNSNDTSTEIENKTLVK